MAIKKEKMIEKATLLGLAPVLVSAGMTMVVLDQLENKLIGLVLIVLGVGCVVVRELRK